MLTIIAAIALSTTSVPKAEPAADPPFVCKRLDKTGPRSFNPRVCATAAEWKAYRSFIQKKEREALAKSQANAGVGSGY